MKCYALFFVFVLSIISSFSSEKFGLLYEAITGHHSLNVVTICCPPPLQEEEDSKIPTYPKISDLKAAVEDIRQRYPNSFLLFVTQEALFPCYTEELENFAKELSSQNTMLVMNAFSFHSIDRYKAQENLESFLNTIWVKIKKKTDLFEETATTYFNDTLQKLDEGPATVEVFNNQTNIYWAGERAFSYKKMTYSSLEEEIKTEAFYLPGKQLHDETSETSKILSEIFGVEICQDHFLETFKKLGGGATEKIIGISRKGPNIIIENFANTRKFDFKKENFVLENPPLFNILQSNTINFTPSSSILNHPHKKIERIVIHADADIDKKQTHAFAFDGETLHQVVALEEKNYGPLHIKIFALQNYLKDIKFEAKLLEKMRPKESKNIIDFTNQELKEPLLNPEPDSPQTTTCCDQCLIF